ncbi:hypothetical protein JCM18899A_44930 [Nocardioides sp. AN3]
MDSDSTWTDSDSTWTEGPTLSAWWYDSPRGAVAGKLRLDRLVQRGAVIAVDVATATWVGGAHRPRVGNGHGGLMLGASRSSPLEVLLSLVLSHPRMSDGELRELMHEIGRTGITEGFLRELRDGLVPDSSALVVLSLGADVEAVQEVIERGRARGDVRLLHTPIDPDGLADLEHFARRSAHPDGELG